MYKLIPLLFILLVGCSGNNRAPVVELKWRPVQSHAKTHLVRRGETLYAIAFRYDLDYRKLAEMNRLPYPYSLQAGQLLQLRSPSSFAKSKRVWSTLPKNKPQWIRQYTPPLSNMKIWHWPLKGRVVTSFIPQQGKKGINIAGRKGEMVHAASDGIVAYAGNGLLGYGNLIIIKHNNQFLTAYGHNARNLVKEGQKVKAGQIIAEIGIVDRSYWGVHFEIRKAGRPVNPIYYLGTGVG